MSARYSDRFFGPEGVSGRPRETPAEATDLVEGVELAPPGVDPASHLGVPPDEAQPWHRHLAARLALVGVLLAGAGGGAYAWDKWRDHETEVLARSTVNLSSSASLDSVSPEADSLAITLHLQNDGRYPVTVTDVAPLDTRLTTESDSWEPVPLDRGEDVLRFLSFGIDCTQEVDSDLSTQTASVLVADLRTVDGRVHEERLGLLGVGYYGGSLGQLLNDQCAAQEQRASYSSLYAEVGVVELDGDAVTSTVVLNDPYTGSLAQSPVTVRAAPAGTAFTIAIVQPTPDEPSLAGSFFLRWTVNDCTAALEASEDQMTAVLQGSMPSEAALSSISVWPTASLAAALARLSERVCA